MPRREFTLLVNALGLRFEIEARVRFKIDSLTASFAQPTHLHAEEQYLPLAKQSQYIFMHRD